MSSKNISLRAEAYFWLKSQKAPNESFSDVIIRLHKQRRGTYEALEKYVGHWNDGD